MEFLHTIFEVMIIIAYSFLLYHIQNQKIKTINMLKPSS